MKEYKTLQVEPEAETDTITVLTRFGWKLEDTREVYNESQEIIGVKEKVTTYGDGFFGSFMRGFTGNDGKVERQVQTRTNVIHYISMRFSRDTDLKHYEKLVQLEDEFYNSPSEPQYAPSKPLKQLKPQIHVVKPVASTVMNVIFVIAALAVIIYLIFNEDMRAAGWAIAIYTIAAVIIFIWTIVTICGWRSYVKIHPNEDKLNEEVAKENQLIEKENEAIAKENDEIAAANANLKKAYETRGETLLADVDEILKENGIKI